MLRLGIPSSLPQSPDQASDVPELVLQALTSRLSIFALGHRFQPPEHSSEGLGSVQCELLLGRPRVGFGIEADLG